MLARELSHRGLLPADGGYSTKLIGWVEVAGVAPTAGLIRVPGTMLKLHLAMYAARSEPSKRSSKPASHRERVSPNTAF